MLLGKTKFLGGQSREPRGGGGGGGGWGGGGGEAGGGGGGGGVMWGRARLLIAVEPIRQCPSLSTPAHWLAAQTPVTYIHVPSPHTGDNDGAKTERLLIFSLGLGLAAVGMLLLQVAGARELYVVCYSGGMS